MTLLASKLNASKRTAQLNFKEVTVAWTFLHKSTGIGVVRTRKQYQRLVALADRIVDEIGSNEKHALVPMLELISTLIAQYESAHHPMADAAPHEVLGLLMQELGLKQSDLREEVGTQGVVSEVLSGKRRINARQAKALADRFGVAVGLFQ